MIMWTYKDFWYWPKTQIKILRKNVHGFSHVWYRMAGQKIPVTYIIIIVWSHQSVSSDELFWHNSSANNANVPEFGTLSRLEVPHM